MARRKFGDLIILLPGITGSVLQCNGKDVWAITPASAIAALFSLGNNIKDLQIKGKDDWTKDDLGDGVTAPRLVQDVHLIPGFWQIDGYTAIKTRLFAELTLEEGKNWFDYPYDWRRDNRVHGRQLGDRAPKWLDAWRKASGNKDAKLVLLAHSMGGLIARDFLERHDGWKITRHLITFGTPYRGSMNAVSTLINGIDKGLGPISVDLSPLVRSFPSMHQLLPIYPSVDVGGKLVRPGEATLPGMSAALAADALKFHRDIEAAVTANSANPAYRSGGYQITPIVGIAQPTDQSAKLTGATVATYLSLGGDDSGRRRHRAPRIGHPDRAVGLPAGDVRVDQAWLAAERRGCPHPGGRHGDPQEPRRATANCRSTASRLDAPTVLSTTQELDLVVKTLGAPSTVRALVEDVATGKAVRRRTLRRKRDGSFPATIPPLAEGVYRVTIASDDEQMTPVSDLVTVIDRRKRKR